MPRKYTEEIEQLQVELAGLKAKKILSKADEQRIEELEVILRVLDSPETLAQIKQAQRGVESGQFTTLDDLEKSLRERGILD